MLKIQKFKHPKFARKFLTVPIEEVSTEDDLSSAPVYEHFCPVDKEGLTFIGKDGEVLETDTSDAVKYT